MGTAFSPKSASGILVFRIQDNWPGTARLRPLLGTRMPAAFLVPDSPCHPPCRVVSFRQPGPSPGNITPARARAWRIEASFQDIMRSGEMGPPVSEGKSRIAPRPTSLALVIPTFHEAGNILPLLGRVRPALDRCGIPYEVIIVDDESGDGIEELVTGISADDPRVRLIVRHGERGLAGAVLRGWAGTHASHLAVMDADLQHPPELLPQLWAAMETGADLAVGSRYASGGSLGGWNAARHFISRVSIWMTLPVQRSGLRARDPMSGFFIVRRECLDGIALQKSGFKILLEILARAHLRSVVEVPFTFGTRQAGQSKAGARIAIEYVLLLLRLFRQKGRTPSLAERELAHAELEKHHEVARN